MTEMQINTLWESTCSMRVFSWQVISLHQLTVIIGFVVCVFGSHLRLFDRIKANLRYDTTISTAKYLKEPPLERQISRIVRILETEVVLFKHLRHAPRACKVQLLWMKSKCNASAVHCHYTLSICFVYKAHSTFRLWNTIYKETRRQPLLPCAPFVKWEWHCKTTNNTECSSVFFTSSELNLP